MNKITAGLAAGLLATVVLSAIMLAKGMMGVMPELDIIAMLSAMMGASASMVWLGHFVIGTVDLSRAGDRPTALGVTHGQRCLRIFPDQ